jgi:penicillin-binding protein 2
MLQALYEGEPPLEAYPTADRPRIEAQQERLRDIQPQVAIKGRDQA